MTQRRDDLQKHRSCMYRPLRGRAVGEEGEVESPQVAMLNSPDSSVPSNLFDKMVADILVKVVEPPTANAKECYTESDHSMANSCQHKWDHLLCWPPTEMETTVAIPCNASVSFVDIVTSSKPSISSDLIPGMQSRCLTFIVLTIIVSVFRQEWRISIVTHLDFGRKKQTTTNAPCIS